MLALETNPLFSSFMFMDWEFVTTNSKLYRLRL